MPTQKEVSKYLNEIVKDVGISKLHILRSAVQGKFNVSELEATKFIEIWIENS